MYRNIKQVKRDSYGEVILAMNMETHEKVIVKGRKRGFIGYESFCHGMLDHPGIPKLMDAYSKDGMEYLVIEYIEGVTLDSLIVSKKPLSFDMVLKWIREALVVLRYIHESGIIHRDLTPQNMVVATDMSLRIIDFGISIPKGFSDSTVAGNLNYAPPEQILTPEQISIQSDIFSLGKSFLDLINQYPYLYPKELRDVLSKAMSMDPKERYVNTNEMLKALACAYC